MLAILHSPAAMKRAARLAMALERVGARLRQPRRAAASPQERQAQAQAQALVARDPAPRAWRALFWAAERAADAEAAEAALGGAPRGVALGHLEVMARAPLGQAALAARLIPQPAPPASSPAPRRLAYVLNNAPPETTNGYAMRGHGMIGGLRALEFEVTALTRPGFPGDLSPATPQAAPQAAPITDFTDYDAVRHHRIAAPHKRGGAVAAYGAAAADALAAGLARLMADAGLRARLGEAGRAWVAAERGWSCAAGAAAAAVALAQERRAAQQSGVMAEERAIR